MVKVIEEAQAKRCTCHNCKAVLEYSFGDISEQFVHDYGVGGDTAYRITCPSCARVVNVSRWK